MCGCIFNDKHTYEKHGFITSNITIQSVVGFYYILILAFGFRSFRRFKTRIMICKVLITVKRANA